MSKLLGSIILLVFLFPNTGFAQGKSNKNRKRLEKKAVEYYNRVINQDHPMFSLTEPPEEFQNESKIVLGQQVHFALLRNTTFNRNSTKVALRKRVYLNDEAAIDDFSEFYYQNSEVVGISIIKPGGTTNKVDLSEAIAVTSEVPKFYQDKFHSDDYYKIALPGLEVGDIVDYFKVFNEAYPNYIELSIPVASEAPIAQQEIIFDVDKLWSSYYKTYNGAPKIKLHPKGGFDMKGRQRKSVKRLVFSAKNTLAHKDSRWSYAMLYAPFIKFMALPPGRSIGKKKQVSNNLDHKELFDVSFKHTSLYLSNLKRKPLSRIKAMKLKEKDQDEAVDIIYRLLRIHTMQSINDETETLGEYSYFLSRNSREIPGVIYAPLFAELLKSIKIDSEIVMVMPKAMGDLSNVLLSNEPVYGVYIPSLKKYYWPTNNFNLPGVSPSHLQGSKGFKVQYSKISKRKKTYSPCTIPMTNIEENKLLAHIDAKIESDNILNMNNEMIMTGFFREYYSSLFLYNTNYLKREIEATKANLSKSELKKDAKKSKNRKKKKSKSDSELSFSHKDVTHLNFNEKKKDRFKNWLESEYKITEIGDFQIVNSGIVSEDKALRIKFDFTSDDYVNKAGPNLVFNIGKLIGKQVELSKEEINNRTVDVNLSTTRMIETNIKITIPEGKSANGLEGLNMNVSNDIGEFVSTAEQIGNVINVKTIKKYKNHNFPTLQWSKMVDFLEAGFQFTEKKVILK